MLASQRVPRDDRSLLRGRVCGGSVNETCETCCGKVTDHSNTRHNERNCSTSQPFLEIIFHTDWYDTSLMPTREFDSIRNRPKHFSTFRTTYMNHQSTRDIVGRRRRLGRHMRRHAGQNTAGNRPPHHDSILLVVCCSIMLFCSWEPRRKDSHPRSTTPVSCDEPWRNAPWRSENLRYVKKSHKTNVESQTMFSMHYFMVDLHVR